MAKALAVGWKTKLFAIFHTFQALIYLSDTFETLSRSFSRKLSLTTNPSTARLPAQAPRLIPGSSSRCPLVTPCLFSFSSLWCRYLGPASASGPRPWCLAWGGQSAVDRPCSGSCWLLSQVVREGGCVTFQSESIQAHTCSGTWSSIARIIGEKDKSAKLLRSPGWICQA